MLAEEVSKQTLDEERAARCAQTDPDLHSGAGQSVLPSHSHLPNMV